MMDQRISRRAVVAGAAGLGLASPFARMAGAQAGATLSLWYEGASPEQQDSLQRLLVEAFEAAHPGATLNVEYRGSALADQLLIALSAGEGPDLVLTNGPSWTGRFVEAGRLAPLDAYAAKFGWGERIAPFALALGTVEGSLYALPKTQEVQVLYYNRTLFDAQGWAAPTTGAEFDAVADAMLAQGIIPLAAGNSGARYTNRHYVSVIWNAQAGPQAIYEALTGTRPWSDEVFVAGIETLKSWWDKGYFGGERYFSIDAQQAFTFMAQGGYGMALQGTWAFAWVPDSFAVTGSELGVAPIPRFGAEAPYPVYPYGLGSHLAINAASENKDLAAEVLDLIMQPTFLTDVSAGWQGEWDVPLLEAGPIPDDPTARMAQEVRSDTSEALVDDRYGYLPWSFWPPKTDDYMKGGIEEVWLGQITAQEFCDNVDRIFQEELAEGTVQAPPART